VEPAPVSLRQLPSVDRLLQSQTARTLIKDYGRSLTVQALRLQLEAAREAIRQGGAAPEPAELLQAAGRALHDWTEPTLKPVINATGVILHTNLGRAPLSPAAQRAVQAAAAGYSTLEFDLPRGVRGKRDLHAEGLLTRLTGAEAALVVTNNAAAVLLALTGLARRKEVLVSRSQLIEIGGGFRIPEIMQQSGAKLREVGTTNRTHLRDYREAIGEHTALILRAHHSNFRLLGFTAEPGLDELAPLAAQHGLALLDDLGSGALLDTAALGLGHEPTVQESLRAGVSLVAFSGDKLLGGPQAGILVGGQGPIDRLRRHPLARALRPDKLCLAGLSATLLHYLREEAVEQIPVWRMIAATARQLKKRAAGWQKALGAGEIVASRSTVGGGSLPEETLPTWTLALEPRRPDALAARLRAAPTPVIARVEQGRVLLDPRTVLTDQEEQLLAALKSAWGAKE
jgi:L-seryl-tRNA(Ser) seleniumtransferase